MKEFYTIQEASQALGIPEQALYYEERKGGITCQMVANRRVIMKDDIEKLKKRLLQRKLFITPKEYCQKNNMSRSKFDYWVKIKKIVTIRIGGRIFVRGEA